MYSSSSPAIMFIKLIMNLSKFSLFLLIFFVGAAGSGQLLAQTHLAVELQHPVYTLLELAEIKGVLNWLPQSKPYPVSTLKTFLSVLTESPVFTSGFSPYERQVMQAFSEQFRAQKGRITDSSTADKRSFWLGSGYQGLLGAFSWGVNTESEFKIDLNALQTRHMYNGIRLYLAGDLGSRLSYYGNFGFTYDKVEPEAFTPYSFTKRWDGFHINFGDKRYSLDGVEPYPYFSFILENEITGLLFNEQLLIRFARLRREWGVGEGSLYLSASARPFEGIELEAQVLPWFRFGYLLGSLGDWVEEAKLKNVSPPDTTPTFQKMLTLQQLEFLPADWLSLSVVSTALWGKRFELGYIMPLMYPVIHQNLHGDFDNVVQVVNLALRIPGYAKLYFSFFADEMEFTSLSEFFKRPRSMIAFQTGLKVPVPYLPLGLVTFQYTKIEPFVYTHYVEPGVSALDHPVDLSYTHDGENLGYALPPNSDELLCRLETLFHPQWLLSLQFRLIRHGTNDPSLPTGKVIYGDVNEPLDYDAIDEYPDKDFLHDGYYDWNTVFTLGARFSPTAFPLTIGVEYSLAYTWWDMNQTGVTPPENTWRSLLSLTLNLFR